MTTVLRLPNMDIVLACADTQTVHSRQPRRSPRIRNLSQSSEQGQKDGESSRGKRRLRYNSVMEEDLEDSDDMELRRREPEHRRLNRLRLMKQTENVSYL